MFYSQFILAKKGPLGTIWIAAHLERKLRKNQVADTDIGVSVDSILFPEVPIALRLSSHLLLGVVRIYSRKVNYLFNDCSETLVKIKQAFRSTAVDLPPEASTAPYHSITLPETFDLDDLELPDSSFCHGNFVDHHVTTREQITLQDPVEDTVYLGSQFGLDERFGDGDASQMGLDFDEDLFADPVSSPRPSSAAARVEEDVFLSKVAEDATCSNELETKEEQSRTPVIEGGHLNKDEARDYSAMQLLDDHSGRHIESDYHNVFPSPVTEVAHTPYKEIRTPDLNEEIFPFTSVQEPSTPQLTEALAASIDDVSVSSSLQKGLLICSKDNFVPVEPASTTVFVSCSVPSLSMGFEHGQMPMLSQNCRPALPHPQLEVLSTVPSFFPKPSSLMGFEQVEMLEQNQKIKGVGSEHAIREQVQSEEEHMKGQMLSAEIEHIDKEVLQHAIMFHSSQDVNLVPISNPQQEVVVETSKEMSTLAYNLQAASSHISNLPMAADPSAFVNSSVLNSSKQHLNSQEFLAPTSSILLTNRASDAQEVSAPGFQQFSPVGGDKQDLHSGFGSQEYGQVARMHNVIMDRSVQQSPIDMQTFSKCMSGQDFNPVSDVHSASGISCSQSFSFHGFPFPASAAPNLQVGPTMSFQQINHAADGKQQLHSTAGAQEYAEAKKMQNLMMSTPVEQNPISMPIFPTFSSGQQFDLTSALQSSAGISSTEQLPIQSLPATATTIPDTHKVSTVEFRPVPAPSVPNMQEMPTMAFQQTTQIADGQQQSHSTAGAQEYAQANKMQDSRISTSVQQYPIAMQTFPTCSSAQQFNLNSDLPSVVRISNHEQLPIHVLPAPATAISDTHKVYTMEFHQLNQVADSRQQFNSAAGAQECSQVTPTENLVFSGSGQEVPKAMRAFPTCSSGQQFNIASGHQSAVSELRTQELPVSGSTSDLAHAASQNFLFPQSLHVAEASVEASNIKTVQGHFFEARNEEANRQKSLHLSVAPEESRLHGVQRGIFKSNDSTTNYLSTDMPRTINVPAEDIYPRRAEVSDPIAMQGVSQGMVDGSMSAQWYSFPLQAGKSGVHTDVPSGNMLSSFTGTHGIGADVSYGNILQPCSFRKEAGTYGSHVDMSPGNHLSQEGTISKITESEGFPRVIPASNMSAPITSQSQSFLHAFDELSNALSVSESRNAGSSKTKQFDTIRFQPENKYPSSEIPAREILRSSSDVVRQEHDVSVLKQTITEKETPMDSDTNTISTKQSAGNKKRHMMDATPVLNEGTPSSRISSSLSKRSMDYIPHDDDVLASILGRTPAFKIKPTPAETVAAKRPRHTPRATPLKRKALIDVSTVLHSDVIRQQLGNTEDIRRVRKKAPCTSREIWMIRKESQAQQIFFEPSIPGLCTELHDLYSQVFGLHGAKFPVVDGNENSNELQKMQGLTNSMERTNDFRAVHLEPAQTSLEIASGRDFSRVNVDRNENSNEFQIMQGLANSMERTNDFRTVQLEPAQSPLEIASEKGFSRVHVDIANDSREVQLEPAQSSFEIAPERDFSRVHADIVDRRQEQEKPLEIVSELETRREHIDTVHSKKEKGRPLQILTNIESSREHLDKFIENQERESLPEMIPEIESDRVNMNDAHHGKQASKISLADTSEVKIGSGVSNAKTTLESSRIQEVQVSVNEVFVPQDTPCVVFQVPGVQDPYVMQEEFHNVREIHFPNQGPSVNNTEGSDCLAANHKSFVEHKEMSNRLRENHETFGEGKEGSNCVAENNKASLEDKEGSRHLVENHGIHVEDRDGSHCLVENYAPSKGPNVLPVNLGTALMEKKESTCLAEHNRLPVLKGMEGAIVERQVVWSKINEEKQLSDKEPNIVEDAKQQCQDFAVPEQTPINGTIVGCECKSRGLIDIVISTPSQGDFYIPNTEVGTGGIGDSNLDRIVEIPDSSVQDVGPEIARQPEQVVMYESLAEMACDGAGTSGAVVSEGREDCSGPHQEVIHNVSLDKIVETPGTSVQVAGPEVTKQHEQVVLYESSAEMDCDGAMMSGAVASEGREDCSGPHHEVTLNVPREDEAMIGSTANDKIDFLGDAKVTEFLGGDDDGQDEFEGKNNAHDAEKDQTQDNSGWSARTRAVSRYLKTVFEGMDHNSNKTQGENQQKLGLDRLLVGKTRKEAARMFFETLVLKTRDYVHVEQNDSFDDISIFPRAKLMKTNF